MAPTRTLLLISLILLSSFGPAIAEDYAEEAKKVTQRIDAYADILEQKAPEYVWGGSDPDVMIFDEKKQAMRKGVDCSGAVTWIVRKAGLPFPRLTAWKIFLTWPGYDEESWANARLPDLIWFQFTAKRPYGHIALVRKHSGDVLEFSEASDSANRFKRTKMKHKSFHDKDFKAIKILDLAPGKQKRKQ